MKTLVLILLAAVASAAQTPQKSTSAPPARATTAAKPAAQDSNAKQARQVLDRCIQAMGGDAYLHIFDLKEQLRGYGFYRGEAAGVGIPYTRYYQYPDKERLEFFREHDWVIIYNGREATETTFHGNMAIDKQDLTDYLRRRDHSLMVVLRDWAHDNAATSAFFYDAATIEETKEVHQITILNKNNDSVTLYIDRKTFLPVKKSYKWRDPVDKQTDEEYETFDKYRMVQGIATPFLVTRWKNGQLTSQKFIKDVAYNMSAGDKMFLLPEITPSKRPTHK
jgi:hypothetical protein